METRDGRLVAVGGASRSGKTAWVKLQTEGGKRVIAWDPEAQWCELPGFKKVTRRPDLLREIQRGGPLKIAYVAGGDLPAEFDFWAGCVMYAGRYFGGLDVISEELADVTTPAKAPGNWGILLRRGLKRDVTIYAISQRWQEADKTTLGNATLCVFFRQNGRRTPKYLEDVTGVPAESIPKMPLEYVIFDPTTGDVTPGRLPFKKEAKTQQPVKKVSAGRVAKSRK